MTSSTDTAPNTAPSTSERIAAAYKRYLTQRMASLPEQPIVELTGSEADIHTALRARRDALRQSVLHFPNERVELDTRTLIREQTPTHQLEKVIFQAEPGSWVTALVYLPPKVTAPLPGLVLASGHGGSKGSLHNQVAGQIFAQLGLMVIVPDTIGEEDRFDPWGLGLRGHRKELALDRLNERGRPFIAKNVFDLSRALDYLLSREEVDPQRVGCAGSSMGGTTTQLLIAADERFTLCLNSAWAADYKLLSVGHSHSKGCCWRLPGTLNLANQEDLFALAAPHCATLVMSGEVDEICPPHGLDVMGQRLRTWWQQRGAPERFDCIIKPGAGHRQYHTTLPGLRWLKRHFHMDFALPETEDTDAIISLGEIVEAAGYKLQPLYDVDRHHRGTRTLNLPLTIREPESTAILTGDVLQRCGLDRDAFTLQGWLRFNETPEAERITTLPQTLAPYPGGLARYLDELLASTTPLSGAPLPDAPEHRSTDDQHVREDWPIALDELKMRILRPVDHAPVTNTALLYLPAQRCHDAPLPEHLPQDTLIAVPDLVCMNDEEMLIGETSAAFNLRLLARCLRLLRTHHDIARIELVSDLPRLGELLCAADAQLASLTLTCPTSAEPSADITYRLESILPGFTRHFRWLDVLLAITPRPLALPRNYVTDEAHVLLDTAYAQHNAADGLNWHG